LREVETQTLICCKAIVTSAPKVVFLFQPAFD
jgi:hypothetical protein